MNPTPLIVINGFLRPIRKFDQYPKNNNIRSQYTSIQMMGCDITLSALGSGRWQLYSFEYPFQLPYLTYACWEDVTINLPFVQTAYNLSTKNLHLPKVGSKHFKTAKLYTYVDHHRSTLIKGISLPRLRVHTVDSNPTAMWAIPLGRKNQGTPSCTAVAKEAHQFFPGVFDDLEKSRDPMPRYEGSATRGCPYDWEFLNSGPSEKKQQSVNR